MIVYYNEHDKFAAATLRELINAGLIAPGIVDDRSILDVTPGDLRGFTQCHFFAGFGVWSYALRRAGWPDDRRVWTGSCPCQPFSAAGKGAGFDDERHLWPAWFQLIAQCRPDDVFGEQVASADGLGWLDLVQPDLEAADYAVWAQDLCAAGVGAPHIRQRLFFAGTLGDADMPSAARLGGLGWASAADPRGLRAGLADDGGAVLVADDNGRGLAARHSRDEANGQRRLAVAVAGGGIAGGLGDADGRDAGAERQQRGGEQRLVAGNGDARSVADSSSTGLEIGVGDGRVQRGALGALAGQTVVGGSHAGGLAYDDDDRRDALRGTLADRTERDADACSAALATRPTDGHWRDADWLLCTDGRWRPVEPGTFPLAHGAPARVGRLRGYGNAIVAPAAEAFIKATGLVA